MRLGCPSVGHGAQEAAMFTKLTAAAHIMQVQRMQARTELGKLVADDAISIVAAISRSAHGPAAAHVWATTRSPHMCVRHSKPRAIRRCCKRLAEAGQKYCCAWHASRSSHCRAKISQATRAVPGSPARGTPRPAARAQSAADDTSKHPSSRGCALNAWTPTCNKAPMSSRTQSARVECTNGCSRKPR